MVPPKTFQMKTTLNLDLKVKLVNISYPLFVIFTSDVLSNDHRTAMKIYPTDWVCDCSKLLSSHIK